MKNIALALALTAIVAAPAFAQESMKSYEASTAATPAAAASGTEVKADAAAAASGTEVKADAAKADVSATAPAKKEGMHKKHGK
jgi:hypothetical protein